MADWITRERKNKGVGWNKRVGWNKKVDWKNHPK